MTESLTTLQTDVVALVPILQLTEEKVQVADTTTRGMQLTGNLTIMLEEFMQRLHHIFKVKCSGGLLPFYTY